MLNFRVLVRNATRNGLSRDAAVRIILDAICTMPSTSAAHVLPHIDAGSVDYLSQLFLRRWLHEVYRFGEQADPWIAAFLFALTSTPCLKSGVNILRVTRQEVFVPDYGSEGQETAASLRAKQDHEQLSNSVMFRSCFDTLVVGENIRTYRSFVEQLEAQIILSVQSGHFSRA